MKRMFLMLLLSAAMAVPVSAAQTEEGASWQVQEETGGDIVESTDADMPKEDMDIPEEKAGIPEETGDIPEGIADIQEADEDIQEKDKNIPEGIRDIQEEDKNIPQRIMESAEEALEEEVLEEEIQAPSAPEGWAGSSYYRDGVPVIGLQEIGGKTYAFGQDGKLMKGWRNIGRKTYYLGEDGAVRKGWQKVNGFSYYFGDDGAQRRGWQTIGGKTYYFYKATISRYKGHYKGVAASGLQENEGHRYCFSKEGLLLTGWQKISGRNYYFDRDGKNLTGIQTINGRPYLLPDGYTKDGIVTYKGKTYLSVEGALSRGLTSYKNGLYFLNGDYTVFYGWKTIGGSTYYFRRDRQGRAANYWLDLNGYRYFFKDCVMATGLTTADSNYIWYYFYPDNKGHYRGTMAKNTWIIVNGRRYHAGKDGRLDTGFVKDSKGLRYFGGDAMMRTGWQYIDRTRLMKVRTRQTVNRWYYFDKDGYAATGRRIINGRTYTFGKDGVLKGVTDYKSADSGMKKSMAANVLEGHLIYDAVGCSIALRGPGPGLTAQTATDLDSTGSWNVLGGKVFIGDHVTDSFRWLRMSNTGDLVNILRRNMETSYKVISRGYGKNKGWDIIDTKGSPVSKKLNDKRVCLYTCLYMDDPLYKQGKEVFWIICEKK